MSDFKIRAALRQRLLTVVGLPAGRQWENEFFEPVVGQPYLKEKLMPTNSDVVSFGANGAADGTIKDDGLWQITLFYPQGEGTKDAQLMAEAIRVALKPSTQLSYDGENLTVMRAVIAPGRDEAVWYSIPITIKYMTHTTN